MFFYLPATTLDLVRSFLEPKRDAALRCCSVTLACKRANCPRELIESIEKPHCCALLISDGSNPFSPFRCWRLEAEDIHRELERHLSWTPYYLRSSETFDSNDDSCLASAIERCGASALQFATKPSKSMCFLAIEKDAWALAYAGHFRNDFDVTLKAVSKNGYSLRYASLKLRDNEQIVLKAVSDKGQALRFASKRLRARKNIVNAAVRNDGLALRYANDTISELKVPPGKSAALAVLRNFPDFFKAPHIVAGSCNNDLLHDCWYSFKNDANIVAVAVNDNGLALQYASAPLRNNLQLVNLALKQNPTSLAFASHHIRQQQHKIRQQQSSY